MPTIKLNSNKLFFAHQKCRGDRLGSLILIHGAGGSHLDWPPELRRSDRLDVYAVDLPGHGRSPSPGCESIEEYSQIIRQFIELRGIEDAILAGHSMGGAIVQHLGLNPPSSTRALVLIATGARLRVAPQILDGVIPDFESTVDLIAQYAWSEDSDIDTREMGKRLMLQSDPQTMLGDFRACEGFDMMEEMPDINLRTLIICGTEDKLTPVKYSYYLANQLQSSRLVTIEGGGHMIMLERPEEVSSLIMDFAASLFEDSL